MGKSDLDLWRVEAEAVVDDTNPLNVPYDVALKEAAIAASFVDKYWKRDATRTGLERVKSTLPHAIAEEIRSLVRATQQAQTQLLLLVDPIVMDHGARAAAIVDSLESALDFLLDDGVHEAADDQLAALKAFHSQDGQRSTALAQALRDYSALAHDLKARLVASDDEFDPALIAEAKKLADLLATAPPKGASAESLAATKLRNKVLTLLTTRVGRVRRAAAHVFKDVPEIVREVTSGYERRRRASARRKKLAAADPGAGAPAGKA